MCTVRFALWTSTCPRCAAWCSVKPLWVRPSTMPGGKWSYSKGNLYVCIYVCIYASNCEMYECVYSQSCLLAFVFCVLGQGTSSRAVLNYWTRRCWSLKAESRYWKVTIMASDSSSTWLKVHRLSISMYVCMYVWKYYFVANLFLLYSSCGSAFLSLLTCASRCWWAWAAPALKNAQHVSRVQYSTHTYIHTVYIFSREVHVF